MSNKFIPTGSQYHKKVHLFWNTGQGGITDIRLVGGNDHTPALDAAFTYWSVAFHDVDEECGGFDVVTLRQVNAWGIEGYLLSLILTYGGITPAAAGQLKKDLSSLGVNAWGKRDES